MPILVDVFHAQARVEDGLGFAEGALDRVEAIGVSSAGRQEQCQSSGNRDRVRNRHRRLPSMLLLGGTVPRAVLVLFQKAQ